jgi:IS30 family transposase
MSYQRMSLAERMDIFRLLYVARLKTSAIAAALNRRPSSITRELEKGMDQAHACRGRTEAADAPEDVR